VYACVGEYARALGLDLEHPPSAQPPRILVRRTRVSSILFRRVPIVYTYMCSRSVFFILLPYFLYLINAARVGIFSYFYRIFRIGARIAAVRYIVM